MVKLLDLMAQNAPTGGRDKRQQCWHLSKPRRLKSLLHWNNKRRERSAGCISDLFRLARLDEWSPTIIAALESSSDLANHFARKLKRHVLFQAAAEGQ